MTIQDMLRGWGASRLVSDPAHVGFPRSAPFARLMPRQDVLVADRDAPPPRFPLPEDVHGKVDQRISALKQKDETRWKVVVLSYRHGMRDSKIAGLLGISRQQVTEMRTRSEYQIESEIF